MHVWICKQIDHSLAGSVCGRSWTDFDQVRILQLRFYERIDQDPSIVLHDMHGVNIWIVQITTEFLHFMDGVFFEERDDLGEVAFQQMLPAEFVRLI